MSFESCVCLGVNVAETNRLGSTRTPRCGQENIHSDSDGHETNTVLALPLHARLA